MTDNLPAIIPKGKLAPRVLLKFKAKEFSAPYVIVEGDYSKREDIRYIFASSQYIVRGTNKVGIPLSNWADFKARLTEFAEVSLSVDVTVLTAVYEYLNAANITVEMKDNHFAVKINDKGVSFDHKVRQLPGCIFDYSSGRNYYKVNLAEAVSLYERLSDVPNVVYDAESSEYVLKAVEKSKEMDKIAKLDDVELDVDINGRVPRNFQKVGVKFLEASGGKALLGDDMGLGKTLQSLMYAQLIGAKKVLVICPASLKANWCREIYMTTKETPYSLFGTSPTNHDTVMLLTEPPRFVIANYDILARNKPTFKSYVDKDGFTHEEKGKLWHWVEVLKLYKPDLIIVDEAHYIKNPDAQRSVAVRMFNQADMQGVKIITMTGTPVLNRPGELWPILNLLFPVKFPVYESFLRQYTWDNKRARNVEELRHMLKDIMIRRLKKDVVKELPPINRINDFHELSDEAAEKYQLVMEGIYETLKEWGTGIKKIDVTNVLTQILRLKQICAFDKMDRVTELAQEIYDSGEGNDYRKVLVFSQFRDVADGIRKRLGSEAVGFDGTMPQGERMKLVDMFQTNDAVKYLVCTTKVASEGLNLTKAGTVIFTDLMWTPAAHQQAEGRAYGRLGDSHSITSYYVIAERTIEDYIIKLLERKMVVIKETVENLDDDRMDESTALELINYIKESMWIKR